MALEVAVHTNWWPDIYFAPINLWSIWNRETKMMNIRYINKDITTVNKGLVIHGCNCSGGFGSGVAGDIKRVWPPVEQMFRNNKNPKLGELEIKDLGYGLFVGNGYTQEFYGYDGRVYASANAVAIVIKKALEYCETENIENLYLPKIGCGLGGLSWETDILPKIKNIPTDINITVCEL